MPTIDKLEELIITSPKGIHLATDNGSAQRSSDAVTAKAHLWTAIAKLAWPRLDIHHADLYHDAAFIAGMPMQMLLDGTPLWFTVSDSGTGIGFGTPDPILSRTDLWMIRVKRVAVSAYRSEYRAFFVEVPTGDSPFDQRVSAALATIE